MGGQSWITRVRAHFDAVAAYAATLCFAALSTTLVVGQAVRSRVGATRLRGALDELLRLPEPRRRDVGGRIGRLGQQRRARRRRTWSVAPGRGRVRKDSSTAASTTAARSRPPRRASPRPGSRSRRPGRSTPARSWPTRSRVTPLLVPAGRHGVRRPDDVRRSRFGNEQRPAEHLHLRNVGQHPPKDDVSNVYAISHNTASAERGLLRRRAHREQRRQPHRLRIPAGVTHDSEPAAQPAR